MSAEPGSDPTVHLYLMECLSCEKLLYKIHLPTVIDIYFVTFVCVWQLLYSTISYPAVTYLHLE